MHRAALLTIPCLLAACASHVKDPVSTERLDSWRASTPITQPIGLIADTQFHESRGHPSPILQRSGDEVAEVTIRSAQQVMGADDLLQRAIEINDGNRHGLLLHAGDAIDLSCSSEWQRFERVMRSKGPPGPTTWVFTPGNHDGYLAGNLSTPPDDKKLRPATHADWAKLCNAGMQVRVEHPPMHHGDVIQAYLRLLAPHAGTPSAVGCNADGTHCWASQVSADEPWTSFIVQLVRMPAAEATSTPIYALMLDSSNYRDLFSNQSIASAGKFGGLRVEQLHAAQELLRHMKDGGRFFFIAHYPIGSWHLNADERAAWQALSNDARSLNFIITAHTHDGELAHHTEALGGIVELNTGSLADAPIYMRSLQFTQGATGEIGFRSHALTLSPTAYDCKAHVPVPPPGPLDYGVDTQRTARSNRAHWSGPERIWHQLVSIFKGVSDKVAAKHAELKPQLLAYADLVARTYPDDAAPHVCGARAPLAPFQPPQELCGRSQLTQALQRLALCSDDTEPACTVQQKANLLLAVERVYRQTDIIPIDRRETAHRMRLCMALAAADESPSNHELERIDRLRTRIALPWSMRLSPRPTVP